MKYMTKEWYETMQKGNLHLLLKVSKKADVYSEEYFRSLYKKEEAEWIKLQEEAANVDVDDIFPEEPESYGEYVNGTQLGPEEEAKAKKIYFEWREAFIEYQNNREPFDLEHEKAVFKAALKNNIKTLISQLPECILKNVADIRVLALNRAAAGVKKEITRYCIANDKAMQQVQNAYWRAHNKTFKKSEPPFLQKFNFHDCTIRSYRKTGKSVVVELDNSGGFTDVEKVIFMNCSVVTKEASLYGAWWLYDEIYKADNGYEIHVLLQSPQRKLLYFTIITEAVELIAR